MGEMVTCGEVNPATGRGCELSSGHGGAHQHASPGGAIFQWQAVATAVFKLPAGQQ